MLSAISRFCDGFFQVRMFLQAQPHSIQDAVRFSNMLLASVPD